MAFTDNTTGGRVIKEGIMPVVVSVTGLCEVGDLIGYDGVTGNVWEQADANGKVPASLIAGESKIGTTAANVVCYKMAVIDGFTSAVAGDMVYLADDVGQYAATPATWVHQCVGECVTTTEAFIHPSSQAVTAYATTGTGWAGYFRYELESGRTGLSPGGGMRIDIKTIATSTVGSDIYGLYIHYQLQQDTAGTNAILRLEDNGSVDQTDAFIMCIANRAGTPTNMFYLGGATAAYTGTGTAKTGNGGWLVCNVGGNTRYINMYTG